MWLLHSAWTLERPILKLCSGRCYLRSSRTSKPSSPQATEPHSLAETRVGDSKRWQQDMMADLSHKTSKKSREAQAGDPLMISFFIDLPSPSVLLHRRHCCGCGSCRCPARLCHGGARRVPAAPDTGDLKEQEPSPRWSEAEMLEDLSELQLLQVNLSGCCWQEGGQCALQRDRMIRMQVGGGQHAGDTGRSHPAPRMSRGEHGISRKRQKETVACSYKKSCMCPA